MRCALMMMRLCAACRNTSVSRTTGTAPDEMTSASTWPGPTEGSLIDIAHDQESGLVRHRLQECLHEHDIDHGGLVDHQQVAIERIIFATFESAPLGVDFEQSADGLGFKAGRPGHSLGGAAGRRAQQKLGALSGDDAQNGSDDCGLA